MTHHSSLSTDSTQPSSPSTDFTHPSSLTPASPPLRWLITGGCGFIGTSLIRQLTAEGDHSIRVIDNLSVGIRDDLANVCKFKELAPNLIANCSSLSPDSLPHRSALILS